MRAKIPVVERFFVPFAFPFACLSAPWTSNYRARDATPHSRNFVQTEDRCILLRFVWLFAFKSHTNSDSDKHTKLSARNDHVHS